MSYSTPQVLNVIKTHESNIKTLASQLSSHDKVIREIDVQVLKNIESQPENIVSKQKQIVTSLIKSLEPTTPQTEEEKDRVTFTNVVYSLLSSSMFELDVKQITKEVFALPLYVSFKIDGSSKNKYVDSGSFTGLNNLQESNNYTYTELERTQLPEAGYEFRANNIKLDGLYTYDVLRGKENPINIDNLLVDKFSDCLEIVLNNCLIYYKTADDFSYTTVDSLNHGQMAVKKEGEELLSSMILAIPNLFSSTGEDSTRAEVSVIIKSMGACVADLDLSGNTVGALIKLLTYSDLAKQGKQNEYAFDPESLTKVNDFLSQLHQSYNNSFTQVDPKTNKIKSTLTNTEVTFIINLESILSSLYGFDMIHSITDSKKNITTFIEQSIEWTGAKTFEI